MTKMNEERPILDSLKEKEKFSCSGILSHLNYVIERLKKAEVHSSEKQSNKNYTKCEKERSLMRFYNKKLWKKEIYIYI